MFAISSLGVALNTVNVGHKKPGTTTCDREMDMLGNKDLAKKGTFA